MADTSATSAVINGIVSLMSAYMINRLGMQRTEQTKLDSETLKEGEQAMNIVSRRSASQELCFGNRVGPLHP